MVLLVSLEMLGQILNSLSEQCHLNLWRTRVALMDSVAFNDFPLLLRL